MATENYKKVPDQLCALWDFINIDTRLSAARLFEHGSSNKQKQSESIFLGKCWTWKQMSTNRDTADIHPL